MARSYTSEEAARLERTHRALLAQVDAALETSPNYEQEIANELSALLYSGQLADEIARDLSSGNLTSGVRPQNLPLIVALARQKVSADPINHLLRARDFGKTSILPAIEMMNAAQGGTIKRLFTSKKVKNSADEAYDYLSSLLSGDYATATRNAIRLLWAIGQSETADALDALSQDRMSFIKALHKWSSRLHMDRPAIAEDAIQRHVAIQDKAAALQGMICIAVHDIQKSTDACIDSAVMRTLAGIPIEDIGRGGRNIRVSALRDGGFKTVADLYGPWGKTDCFMQRHRGLHRQKHRGYGA